MGYFLGKKRRNQLAYISSRNDTGNKYMKSAFFFIALKRGNFASTQFLTPA